MGGSARRHVRPAGPAIPGRRRRCSCSRPRSAQGAPEEARKHMPITSPGTAGQAAGQLERAGEAITAFGRGEFVIVFDDESRENEGDLMVAAEHTDHRAMTYLLTHTAEWGAGA